MTCIRCSGVGKIRNTPYTFLPCPLCTRSRTPLPRENEPLLDPFKDVPTNPSQRVLCPACRGGCVTREEHDDGSYKTSRCVCCAGDGLVPYEAASEWFRAQSSE